MTKPGQMWICFAIVLSVWAPLPARTTGAPSYVLTLYLPFDLNARYKGSGHSILACDGGSIIVSKGRVLARFTRDGEIVRRSQVKSAGTVCSSMAMHPGGCVLLSTGWRYLHEIDPKTLAVKKAYKLPISHVSHILVDGKGNLFCYAYGPKDWLVAYEFDRAAGSFSELFKFECKYGYWFRSFWFSKDRRSLRVLRGHGKLETVNLFGISTGLTKFSMRLSRQFGKEPYRGGCQDPTSDVVFLHDDYSVKICRQTKGVVAYLGSIGTKGYWPGQFRVIRATATDKLGNLYTLSRGSGAPNPYGRAEEGHPDYILQRFSPTSIASKYPKKAIRFADGYLGKIGGTPVTKTMARMLSLPVDHGLQISERPPRLRFLDCGGKKVSIRGRTYIVDADIVLSIGGASIDSQADVARAMKGHKPGETVVIEYYDASEQKTKKGYAEVLFKPHSYK